MTTSANASVVGCLCDRTRSNVSRARRSARSGKPNAQRGRLVIARASIPGSYRLVMYTECSAGLCSSRARSEMRTTFDHVADELTTRHKGRPSETPDCGPARPERSGRPRDRGIHEDCRGSGGSARAESSRTGNSSGGSSSSWVSWRASANTASTPGVAQPLVDLKARPLIICSLSSCCFRAAPSGSARKASRPRSESDTASRNANRPTEFGARL